MKAQWPNRWQDCRGFVEDLAKREYVAKFGQGHLTLFMSDGIYLYMYELWQDGMKRKGRRPSG